MLKSDQVFNRITTEEQRKKVKKKSGHPFSKSERKVPQFIYSHGESQT